MVLRKNLPDEATQKRFGADLTSRRESAHIDPNTRVDASDIKFDRAFLNFEVKAVDDDGNARIIEGWATTVNPDRMDDIVDPDGAKYKLPIPLLHQHDRSMPIGSVKRVERRKNGYWFQAEIKKDTGLDYVEIAWKQIKSGLVKALSIGFRALEYEPLKSGGLRFKLWEWLELSTVTIPANADCTIEVIRSLAPECDLVTGRCDSSAKRQLEEASVEPDTPRKSSSDSTQPAVRDSAISGHSKSSVHRNTPMKTSLSDRINAAEESLVAKRDALTAIVETEVDASGELTEEASTKASELASQIEKAEVDIANLKKYENALRAQVKSAVDSKGDRNPYVSMQKQRQKGHNYIGAITAKVKAHGERLHPLQIASEHYKDDPEIGLILKAETDPAGMTSAASLVQTSVAEFFDLLRDQSIYQQIPGTRLQFDRYGSISVPYNSSARGALAGGFVGEGSAIPVKAGGFAERTMAPKKMGVISTFSKEIAMHSVPSIQALIQNQIIADTAEALDTAFLDANARTTTRPAGMQDPADGAGAANIVGSSGATVANIVADLKGVLGRAMAARVGNSGVWVMNPLRRLGLMTVQDAASGEYPFRDEVNRGMLYGYPIVLSQNVDPALVAFIPSDTVAFANDYAPRIDVSDSATLHMEDATPLPVVDGAGAAAAPVRSLYQTDTMAVRMTLGLDWLIIRPNGCQVLTGVAW